MAEALRMFSVMGSQKMQSEVNWVRNAGKLQVFK